MLGKDTDLTGRVFGKWTVVRPTNRETKYSRFYVCRCECGREATVSSDSLLYERTKSCRYCANEKRAVKHGLSRTSEYRTWLRMILKQASTEVCKEWRDDASKFIEDVGKRPRGYRLERINPDIPYRKDNVKWVPTNRRLAA